MNTLKIAATAVALLTASSLAAWADEATGTIQSMDDAANSVTLYDGNTYILPQGMTTASLKLGESVTIEYSKGGDQSQPVATSVKPAG